MKNRAISCVMLATLLFTSCDDVVTFSEPQPANARALAFLPRRLQGRYLSADEHSTLVIDNKWMVRIYDFTVNALISKLKPGLEIKGDSASDHSNGVVREAAVFGDSVAIRVTEVDTVFSISAGDLLTKFKGYYFLNHRYDDNSWQVTKLELRNEILLHGSVDIGDVEMLSEITGNNSGSPGEKLTFSRNDFKRFVAQNGFSFEKSYLRIRQ